jgi:hypothetical protein
MQPTAPRTRSRLASTAVVAIGGLSLVAGTQGSTAATRRTATVRLSGGHETDSRDGGRPVVLVAAALGVPTSVFRTAFSGVTPAPAGSQPDPAQVLRNKAALLKVLAPYGVTNEALDAASDHYRFDGAAGGTWPQTAATARAVVRAGKVVSVRIVEAGAGYSSTPHVSVAGYPKARVRATLSYGKDLARNGSVRTLTLVKG